MATEIVGDTINALELLVLERYNLRSPDDSEPFDAIRGLRKAQDAASLARLSEVLGSRELYRWAVPIKACLRALRGELDAAAAEAERIAEEEAAAEVERIAAMKKAEEERLSAEKAAADAKAEAVEEEPAEEPVSIGRGRGRGK